MKLHISLVAILVLSACGSAPTRLTGESEQTRGAIAAHRACAAKNLDAMISEKAVGSFMDRAVAAEKPCVLEREALRNAIEIENREPMAGDRYSKIRVASFADASIRFTQERLLRELAFAQTQVNGPVEVSLTGIRCSAVRPVFPRSVARDQSFSSASVTAQVEILPSGAINSVVVTRSSGFLELDASVFDALIKMNCTSRPDASANVVAKQYFDFRLE